MKNSTGPNQVNEASIASVQPIANMFNKHKSSHVHGGRKNSADTNQVNQASIATVQPDANMFNKHNSTSKHNRFLVYAWDGWFKHRTPHMHHNDALYTRVVIESGLTKYDMGSAGGRKATSLHSTFPAATG